MGFFDSEAKPRKPLRALVPVWSGPPQNVVPGVVAGTWVLEHTDDLALYVPAITAYPSGFELVLSIRLREKPPRDDFSAFGAEWHDTLRNDGTISPELLRFGIQFSDGRRATNVDKYLDLDGDAHASGPRLTATHGHGTETTNDNHYWIWRLPPQGDLTLVCEWPARKVPQRTVSLDAGAVLAAASEATELWPRPAD